ncbi:MAG: hypothetical protein A2487_02385 [Candidatus Raymondbacteria bacterium RifOxyC12_full_50_8]|uniref:DUF4258 domain-containing protein n=1 Tax=Candidatus Raymondbacteria bacterium RIFOXYD12_FULL_49_13 TaxID=1817890 RepID=A0A1F7FHP9_UNCRA|nr:MAG: hypothetical protein A2248_20930 [Candidatus Raymondbacteria bacterium RIFOXYA2_FULL_49_16]OGJ99525.1 MAG: hypothetical protein A2350_05495 [Candidatus Raymondbacteria bacterium RifOxyB12_full_50_8]OGK06254.1 MAG: hypothetical protein A2519_08245 [Candidatus Raymondbacteria bacterium RIFOXYD12_FULL_49_13]OGK07711.1 MAG: hypothetical protein A2487_02385 [Candidatus Raymondbacteria bacterium RifOxyC12_full_50_8]OGP40586.1 MAG: hypothetical protein A2324_03000 [Candidatus Raymondbacteria b
MVLIEEIRTKIRRRHYELSKHAVDVSIIRNISMRELEEAVASKSEIIEDYPDDKYGPSCLILGFTGSGRPLHLHCSYPTRPIIKVITLYEPDTSIWIEFRKRKPIVKRKY